MRGVCRLIHWVGSCLLLDPICMQECHHVMAEVHTVGILSLPNWMCFLHQHTHLESNRNIICWRSSKLLPFYWLHDGKIPVWWPTDQMLHGQSSVQAHPWMACHNQWSEGNRWRILWPSSRIEGCQYWCLYIYLDFTVTEEISGERQIVDLVPGGSSIGVTEGNQPEYFEACLKY